MQVEILFMILATNSSVMNYSLVILCQFSQLLAQVHLLICNMMYLYVTEMLWCLIGQHPLAMEVPLYSSIL